MYEKYYGLSAPPFQINPDPGFFFASEGHGAAYEYLRYGAFQGEGFIVVTGEIGAGKTTLLRALLAELDPAKVIAAQLVSTQLAADDLLSAVALAFGISIEGLSKAKLLVTLEAFLATLATARRRALLIIDEAQNLSLEAIEELRMLSNFQFGNQALLQSFLVGQPELRDMLRAPRMEQLRQRVLASCHLGPMKPEETRAYIEHRLRHVGWQGRPSFDRQALDLIHLASQGVPRRINTLCNRVLLSAYLDEVQHIDAERVRRIDRELRGESNVGTVDLPQGRSVTDGHHPPLLCVADSLQALWGLAMLLRAFARREDLPEVHLLRVVGGSAIVDDSQAVDDLHAIGLNDAGVRLPTGDGSPARCMADVAQAVAAQLDLHQPSALVVAGDGIAGLACALAGVAARVPLVRVDNGTREELDSVALAQRRALLDRMSTLIFVATDDVRKSLLAQGLPQGAVHAVGSLAADSVQLALGRDVDPQALMRREGLPISLLTDPAGYVIVGLRDPSEGDPIELLALLEEGLRTQGWRVNLLCPIGKSRRQQLAPRSARSMFGGVRLIGTVAHDEWVALIRHSRCLLTDDPWLRAQATALGVPCLAMPPLAVSGARSDHALDTTPGWTIDRVAHELADVIASGGRRMRTPELFDGHAGDRTAALLSDWLLGRQDHEYQRYLQWA